MGLVRVVSTRTTEAARVLVGRTLEEAFRLLPLLFALCGRAQAEAAHAALDEIAQRPVPNIEARARRAVVAAEAVDQHLRAVLLEWPKASGAEPAMAGYLPLRRAARAVAAHLGPKGFALGLDRCILAPSSAELQSAVRVLDEALEELVPLSALEAPTRWATAASGPVSGALRSLLDAGFADWGRDAVSASALSSRPQAAAVQAALEEPGFSARPVGPGGQVIEVGPLAAQADNPAIEKVRRAFGWGLFTRLVARLVDLWARQNELRSLVNDLVDADPTMIDASALRYATGVGTGRALTARGPLFHRLAVEAGQVLRWQVVAPTEWNLHPEGAIQALSGLPVRPKADMRLAAQWWLTALDPCVPFVIEIEEGES